MNDEIPTEAVGKSAVVDPPVTEPDASPRSHRLGRRLLYVVAVLLWIRIVLFGWLFPMIEQHVDNPDFDGVEAPAQSDPAIRPTAG